MPRSSRPRTVARSPRRAGSYARFPGIDLKSCTDPVNSSTFRQSPCGGTSSGRAATTSDMCRISASLSAHRGQLSTCTSTATRWRPTSSTSWYAESINGTFLQSISADRLTPTAITVCADWRRGAHDAWAPRQLPPPRDRSIDCCECRYKDRIRPIACAASGLDAAPALILRCRKRRGKGRRASKQTGRSQTALPVVRKGYFAPVSSPCRIRRARFSRDATVPSAISKASANS